MRSAAGGPTTDGRFVGLDTSQRVLDTRRDGGQPLATGGTINFGLPSGVPANQIEALVVNITGTSTIGEGFVQAYPGGNSGDIYKSGERSGPPAEQALIVERQTGAAGVERAVEEAVRSALGTLAAAANVGGAGGQWGGGGAAAELPPMAAADLFAPPGASARSWQSPAMIELALTPAFCAAAGFIQSAPVSAG